MTSYLDKANNIIVGDKNNIIGHGFAVGIIDGYPALIFADANGTKSNFSRSSEEANQPSTTVIKFCNLNDYRTMVRELQNLDEYPMLETLMGANEELDQFIAEDPSREEGLTSSVEDRDRAVEIMAFKQDGMEHPNIAKFKAVMRSAIIARYGDLDGRDGVEQAQKYIGRED